MRELDVLAVDRAVHDDAIALVVSADHDAVAAVIVGDVLAVVSPGFSLGPAQGATLCFCCSRPARVAFSRVLTCRALVFLVCGRQE